VSSSVVAAATFGADLDFATNCKWSMEKMHRPLRRASERQTAEQNKPRRPLRSGVDLGRRGIADLYCTRKPRETFATMNMAIGRAGKRARERRTGLRCAAPLSRRKQARAVLLYRCANLEELPHSREDGNNQRN
jgi:hypothetical protein